MAVSNWTPADSATAQQIWAEYERLNDLSSRLGQTAGIDPASGRNHNLWRIGYFDPDG